MNIEMMLDPHCEECEDVLQRYSRPIAHMREQFRSGRLGLVFGAGIGKSFAFPDWKTLLGRIAKEVQGQEILECEHNLTAQAQQLYQRFKQKRSAARVSKEEKNDHLLAEMKLRAEWRKLVHGCLYKGVPDSIEEIRKRDTYLGSFLEIVRNSPLTVTYNFDNMLERLLAATRTGEQKSERGYTAIWSGNVQLPSKRGVVYHPNGFLPRGLREKPSDDLVFLEDSFADQLIDSTAGRYTALAAHMAQTTCLLVGLSLSDPTLKHLLRQTAKAFPGHCHYRIAYTENKAPQEQQKLEAAASFNVYNLLTLHLTTPEYKALATLISLAEDRLMPVAEQFGATSCFRFMVTGAVGVGKSTLISHMRSLLIQDEWTEERPSGMEKAPDLLTSDQKRLIDKWIAEQIAQKNLNLMNAATGVHLVDRAPLDAFAFTSEKKWKEKARLIRSSINPGKAKKRKLVGAHVIFLVGDPRVMAARAISVNKLTTAERLKRQQDLLKHVYEPLGLGVTVVDTTHKTIPEVVKECAEIVFFREYHEADLDYRLNEILEKGYE